MCMFYVNVYKISSCLSYDFMQLWQRSDNASSLAIVFDGTKLTKAVHGVGYTY